MSQLLISWECFLVDVGIADILPVVLGKADDSEGEGGGDAQPYMEVFDSSSVESVLQELSWLDWYSEVSGGTAHEFLIEPKVRSNAVVWESSRVVDGVLLHY
jgi:hypothetical protein